MIPGADPDLRWSTGGVVQDPGRDGPSPSRRPRVLAAIVNYDRADLTLNVVRSLSTQATETDLSVIVVDSGSRDADLAELESGLPGSVRLVRLGANLGYAAACNRALAIGCEESHDAIWLLNNDIDVEPDSLDQLWKCLAREPRVAAVAPVTVAMSPEAQILGAGVRISAGRGRVRHILAGEALDRLPTSPYRADALEGAALLVRARAIRGIGGFDEAFFMYWEDTEWSMRARVGGWHLMVVPAARVRHAVSQSSIPLDRAQLMIRNRIRFMRATASLAQQLGFMTYMIVGWLPAFTVARLIPRHGWTAAIQVSVGAVLWNVRDARRLGWDLRERADRIPRPCGTSDTTG